MNKSLTVQMNGLQIEQTSEKFESEIQKFSYNFSYWLNYVKSM